MIKEIEEKGWFPDLTKAIESRNVRTFYTQREAIEAAMAFGWGKNVHRIERRFERIWIVATLDFQPTIEAGIEFQTLRIPMLRYDTGENGIKYQPVLQLKRPYKN